MIRDARIDGVASVRSDAGTRRVEGRAGRLLPMEMLGMLYFLMIVVAGSLLVWQPAKVAETNEKIAALEAQLKDLKLRNEFLKNSVASMESLDYVEEQAKSRLGMVAPQEVRTFALESPQNSNESNSVSTPQQETKTAGIMSLFQRIAQIFGANEAVAKGQQ